MESEHFIFGVNRPESAARSAMRSQVPAPTPGLVSQVVRHGGGDSQGGEGTAGGAGGEGGGLRRSGAPRPTPGGIRQGSDIGRQTGSPAGSRRFTSNAPRVPAPVAAIPGKAFDKSPKKTSPAGLTGRARFSRFRPLQRAGGKPFLSLGRPTSWMFGLNTVGVSGERRRQDRGGNAVVLCVSTGAVQPL